MNSVLQMFVAGTWIDAASGETFRAESPATGETIGDVASGGRDAATRANEIWKKTLEEYEKPPIDDGLEQELKAFVDRRRTELGD